MLRDAYSTARVQSYGTEASGAVGVALAGSTTERVYAAGPVGASTPNTGGVAGYGYTGTVLRAYLLTSVADLGQLTAFPAQRFRLAADLDLSGRPRLTVARTGFTGELDGAGHRLTGFTSPSGGLFPLVAAGGRVHSVSVDGAAVETAAANVGILVNTSHGVVERVYATGHVEVVGDANAGGISGYAYAGTTLRDSMALNAASEAVVAGTQSVPATGPDTLNGATRTAAEAASQATYEAMGWDFATVWTFDAAKGRPVLR